MTREAVLSHSLLDLAKLIGSGGDTGRQVRLGMSRGQKKSQA
jgi:hypothetical protein